MGYYGSRLFPPSTGLIEALTRAYSDEWFGHYNYLLAAQSVQGLSAGPVIDLLRRKSDECLDRAQRLAQRLTEMNNRPTMKLLDMTEHATDKPFKMPADPSDLRAFLEAVLDAERTSMKTHRALYDLAVTDDPLTTRLALDLLAESVAGEQAIETLLGEAVPEKDGS